MALPSPIGTHQQLGDYVRDVEDWPKAGVTFRDLTPLFSDSVGWRGLIDGLCQNVVHLGVDVILGVEARGFVVAAPVAYALGVGFVPVRKPNKLPAARISQSYDLEYGSDALEVHSDAVHPGQRVLIIDDVLATGGTAGATISLVDQLQGQVVGLAFVAEIEPLGGRPRILDTAPDADVSSLVVYR
jgi:adenine phosphoribosyltransferase